VAEIDQKVHNWNEIWMEKSTKIEKSNDQLVYQMTSINK